MTGRSGDLIVIDDPHKPDQAQSGFMFPFRGMPVWAQVLDELLPLTHFLRVIRALMLKGADYAAVSALLAALILFAIA